MKINSITILIVFLLSTLTWTKVMASDYEEVTYDSLVQELSKKKSKVLGQNNSQFDEIKIHAGFGLIGSMTSIKAKNNSATRYQDGLLLSLGIDLFSNNWFAEGVFRNFGTEQNLDEDISLKEFDLKMMHKKPVNNRFGYRIGGGLTTRYLTYSSSKESYKESTPFSLLAFGFDSYLSKNISAGIEFTGRTSMVSRSIDKNAFDISLRLNSFF